MRLANLNAMTREEFKQALGFVFEDSPWVAERAWELAPFASVAELTTAMSNVVGLATREEKLALLRAHPDLGAKARMSVASVGEQRGAGLDQLTAEELAELTAWNRTYRERFGFPFLFAVRGADKTEILAALRRRAESTPEEEFGEALTQVYRIAGFRLHDLLDSEGAH